jgi:hypothetical protein
MSAAKPGVRAMHILDTVAPGLAKQIEALTGTERLELVATACLCVNLSTELEEVSTHGLLEAIKSQRYLSPAELRRVEQLSEDADNRYFSLKEQGAGEDEWYRWFQRARLWMAIKEGFEHDNADKAANSIYELCTIEHDPAGIVRVVREQIGYMMRRRQGAEKGDRVRRHKP